MQDRPAGTTASAATRGRTLGLEPPQPHPSIVRALGGLAWSVVLRLLREGLVVRALAWPGLLTALTMFLSAGATLAWVNNPLIYVTDASLVAPLEAEQFQVVVTPDAEAEVLRGKANRGIWREGERYVLGVNWGGPLGYRAESVLRDLTNERWRLEVPPPARRSRDSVDLQPVTGAMAGIVGLLFTLYGVVIGAGSLYRDRSSGMLESDLALPVPRWMHAAARVVALATVLGPALVVSLCIVDTLLPIHRMAEWFWNGFLAALLGGSLGVALMSRAGAQKGFSAPLSQALTASMGLITLGYLQPRFGHHLPLVALGSGFAGTPPSGLVLPLTLLFAVVVAADFHRRELV